MTNWNEYHSDPRVSYYLSLRQDYRCSAREAHSKLRRADAAVIGLQLEWRPAVLFAHAFADLLHDTLVALRATVQRGMQRLARELEGNSRFPSFARPKPNASTGPSAHRVI